MSKVPSLSPSEGIEMPVLWKVRYDQHRGEEALPIVRRPRVQERSRGRCDAGPEKDPENYDLRQLRQAGVTSLETARKSAFPRALFML
jgi:hypothetical protein